MAADYSITAKKVNCRLQEYKQIKALIKRAFPKVEQMPMWVLLLMARNQKTNFYAYYDEKAFCGISYTYANDKNVFVLYLAVNDEIRSKGYGSMILDKIKDDNKGKIILLNVEAPDEKAANADQRKRRVVFYEKSGFHSTQRYVYDGKEKYLILSTGREFSESDYDDILKQMSHGSYRGIIQ